VSDRIFGGFCVALAGFFIWQATRIESSFFVDSLGPKGFPIIIGITLGAAGLYPLLKPDARPDWPAAGRLAEIAFAIAVMVAYAEFLEPVGFVPATAVAAGLLSWRLGAAPLHAAVAGVGISLAIYVIFHLVLGLSLAQGPWGI